MDEISYYHIPKLFRSIGGGDPCYRQEGKVSQLLHSHPKNFRLLTSHPLPFFVSKSFSSATSAVRTPAAVKSRQSHNSYILTHRRFRLLTSRPLALFVSKSFSSVTSTATTPAAVKSGLSHNSYIFTHRMFRLLTSHPFPLFVSKSFSSTASIAATLLWTRAFQHVRPHSMGETRFFVVLCWKTI